eukprot:248592_1
MIYTAIQTFCGQKGTNTSYSNTPLNCVRFYAFDIYFVYIYPCTHVQINTSQSVKLLVQHIFVKCDQYRLFAVFGSLRFLLQLFVSLNNHDKLSSSCLHGFCCAMQTIRHG